MKTISKIAAAGTVLVASFLPMGVASAKDTCTPPYCNPDIPSGGVLPSEAEKPAVAEQPAETESSPSGELPFTGGDVVGMTIIGAGALGVGTVLVRRSKKGSASA